MHEIVASMQVKIQIPDNIKITVGNIATTIHSLGIEKKLAEEIIHTIDQPEKVGRILRPRERPRQRRKTLHTRRHQKETPGNQRRPTRPQTPPG